MPRDEREAARDFQELAQSLQRFEREVQDATKATKDETKTKKSGLGTLATGAGAALAGLAGSALVSSLSNPNLSFGQGFTDNVGGALAAIGIGDVQGRNAITLAEQRTSDFAARLGRGGRRISNERLEARQRLETQRAQLEVQNVDRVKAIAARARNEALARSIPDQGVSAMEKMVHEIKQLTNKLPGIGGR